MARDQFRRSARGEPPLEELLQDEVTHLVMRRDGVAMRDLLAVIDGYRRRAKPGHHSGRDRRYSGFAA